jgi:colicin import membrane protein
MSANLTEFITEQRNGLVELMKNLRQSRVKAAREAARSSASRIKALNQRVRALAKSGLRVNEVSHGAAQNLIELQADIVTSALTDAAAQIERLSYTETARDFARLQGEVMQATRQRIVDDLARAVTALKGAASDVRKAVVRRDASKPAKAGKAVRRGAKAPARAKTTAGARVKAKAKTKAKAKAKTKAKAKAKTKTKAKASSRKPVAAAGRRRSAGKPARRVRRTRG